jgi:predicted transcriptional regulator
MQNSTTTQFTELEKKVLDAYIPMLYAEAGFSDVDAHDLSKETGITMRSIRGVIGSLVQKGVIWTDENDSHYVIIYLSQDFYHLHPTWSAENN